MSRQRDLRWAETGQARHGVWSLAWAQLIGAYHKNLSEDSVAHSCQPFGRSGEGISVAVADGVGGGARGDVASAALAEHCVQAPATAVGDSANLGAWMLRAEEGVQQRLRRVSYSPGAATVVAAWLLPDGRGHITRVGDARAYCFKAVTAGLGSDSGVLTPLTTDQTYRHLNVPPPVGVGPDDPARMVGTGCMGEPEIAPLQLEDGQILLLCSDGLHRGISCQVAAGILNSTVGLSETAFQLARAARAGGSQDDISVLLLQRASRRTQSKKAPSIGRFKKVWELLRAEA